MKKSLILITLIFSLIGLSACNKNEKLNNTSNLKTTNKSKITVTTNNEDKSRKNDKASNKTSNKEKENSNEVKNTNSTNEEKENKDEKNIKTTKSTPSREVIRNLAKNSDYVSRVRIQMNPNNETKPTFIEDYKGDLSIVEIELPKNLLANREYIIFYSDNNSGKIVPTRADESFIELESENDSTLSFVESLFTNNKIEDE
ncbi:MAG: ferlin [Peptoniphilaceae bacterium]